MGSCHRQSWVIIGSQRAGNPLDMDPPGSVIEPHWVQHILAGDFLILLSETNLTLYEEGLVFPF